MEWKKAKKLTKKDYEEIINRAANSRPKKTEPCKLLHELIRNDWNFEVKNRSKMRMLKKRNYFLY